MPSAARRLLESAVLSSLRTLAWLACVVYSTIPSFWLMIHPHVGYWRSRTNSPYRTLVPAWLAMWIVLALLTSPWRRIALYNTPWTWLPAAVFFAAGFRLYFLSGLHFSQRQLMGIPELQLNHRDQRLVTTGIRAHVRHPVYLAHLCEMLASSIGSGLAVCYVLTVLAIATGAIMIRLEDAELEKRFGSEYTAYRKCVPAVIPRLP
jgi:protein-S-isoprenylcysteine O-methyltransferase Ste14